MELVVEIDSYKFYCTVTDYQAYSPAKTWGKPEDCYPAEEEEIEWDCYSVEWCDEEYREEGCFDLTDWVDEIEQELLKQIRALKEESEEYY